jgi:hypothetical protein
VSTGVHNIAFSLSPDHFRTFDLVFFSHFFFFFSFGGAGARWAMTVSHERVQPKSCRTGWGQGWRQ